jgi:predicted secreted acid phosphatase
MPAKKAAKKAAQTAADSPEAEKKAVKKVARKAAKKAVDPTKATSSKKKAVSPAAAETTDVELSAYLNYRSRIESGFHGDELGDWLAAEKAPEA